MLQATLEMEFLHQTLNTHVSSNADATLQEIYKIISAAYKPPPSSSSEGANELQKELEQLKMTLTQARQSNGITVPVLQRKKGTDCTGGKRRTEYTDWNGSASKTVKRCSEIDDAKYVCLVLLLLS